MDDDAILLFALGLGLWLYFRNRNRNPGSFVPYAPEVGTGMQNDIIPLTVSAEGKAFIKQQEGFKPSPYPDAKGYSIGYGHFILPGENYQSISKIQASNLMDQDLVPIEDAINSSVAVPINQNQFDALADFIYNVGIGAFKTSTLLRVLNTGDYAGAAAQFGRWANANRRTADSNLFQTG